MTIALKTVRIAAAMDFDAIADIHCQSLGDTLLGSFGKFYLSKIHYPKVFEFNRSVTVVSELNGKVTGFVTFVSDSSKFQSYISERSLMTPLFVLAAVIRNPKIIRDIFALLRGTKIKILKDLPDFVHSAELFTIAVSPASKGGGIGKSLIEFGLENLRKTSPDKKYCLVKTHTRSLARFYRKCGFKLVAFERRGSTHFAILAKSL